jgi:hypothetical protein
MNISSTDTGVQVYDTGVKAIGLFRRVAGGTRANVCLDEDDDDTTRRAKNRHAGVEQLYTRSMNARSPYVRKQRRLSELKRHALHPTMAAKNDILYRTIHPSKLDVRQLVAEGSDAFEGNKKSQGTKIEFSKKSTTTKAGGSLSLKYQLLRRDLRQLPRSISDGSGTCRPLLQHRKPMAPYSLVNLRG